MNDRSTAVDNARAARSRIAGIAIRTPLVRLELPESKREIHLKLENLQPIGSFKLRGAANAMAVAGREALARGVYTASAGNMAQGVAYCARRFGVKATIVVPDRAPQIKLDAITRLGATYIKVSFDEWWQAMVEHKHPGVEGLFVHPFEDPAVIAGNSTMGLEILEDLAGADAVLVPWGGGGSACGIAAVVRELSPKTRVYPVEVDVAAPLTASFRAGKATTITPQANFVDGMSGKSVFESMWERARTLLEKPLVLSVDQIAAAVRLLAERGRIVAEGAGAAPLAAALNSEFEGQRVVCLVSGGNIDTARFTSILRGEAP